jgi:hypothetical protein
MVTSKINAILAGLLIAVLLWGGGWSPSAGSMAGGASVPVALAAPKGTPGATLAPPPSPSPSPTRRRIVAPIATDTGLLNSGLPTPTPRFNRLPIATVVGNQLPCDYAASIVLIIPLGHLAGPGIPEVKGGVPFDMWVIMKNTGSCPWGSNVALTFAEKETLGANPLNVPAGDTPPGVQNGFVLHLLPPTAPGYHVGHWLLRTSEPRWFGPMVQIVIHVSPPSPPVNQQ